MIKNKLVLIVLLLSIMFFDCKKHTENVCNEGDCSPINTPGSYHYPILPGTPQWAAFISNSEMLQACQIPADTLSKMSTESLVQTCLDFPLLLDIGLNVGGNVPGRVAYFMTNFSGMNALYKRSDIGRKMFERYSKIYPSCVTSYQTLFEKGRFCNNLAAFELMIGYDSILAKTSSVDIKSLVTTGLNKYYCKKQFSSEYSLYSVSATLYLLAKIMVVVGYPPFADVVKSNTDLKNFILNFLWPIDTDSMFNIIIYHAETFAKN